MAGFHYSGYEVFSFSYAESILYEDFVSPLSPPAVVECLVFKLLYFMVTGFLGATALPPLPLKYSPQAT